MHYSEIALFEFTIYEDPVWKYKNKIPPHYTYIHYIQLLIYNFCKHRNKPYSKLYNLTNNAATPPWSAANALFRFQNKRKNGNNNITTWWGGLKVRWLLFGKHQQHRSKLWPLVSNPKKIERVQLTILVQVTTAFIGPSKS